ncbi:MAG: DapH/DapD/GlmU-related protein [Terracidiphilus sp.]|jgi:serine acetyltransferase
MTKRCKPPLLWLTQLIIGVLPPTRFFRLKAKLLSISGVDIHSTARLCSSVKIVTSGYLAIGADTAIGHQSLIGGGDASISIGSNCDIGPRVSIITGDHEFAPTGPRAAGPGFSKPIVIEDGVWIGAGSLILRGVRIGRRAVICAGSVVARDIPAGSYAIGAGTRLVVHT